MTFEFDGEKYKKASTHQKEWGAKLIGEFEFTGSEHILDLGCGDGAITAQLAGLVPNGFVLGIDASQGMIKTARDNYRQDNLKFELLDINSLNFTNRFDIIISNAALHWVKDHETLLHNVHHALKDKGTARFNFAADGNCANFFRISKEVMQLPKYAGYFTDFIWPWYMPDLEEYKSLAVRFPFSEVTVWGENADRYFPKAETMIKWIDQPSIVPFLKYLSKPDKKAFRNTVVEKMIQETTQPDGTCFETFRRVNLKAKKQGRWRPTRSPRPSRANSSNPGPTI
ncbi:MAG: methyltransferase domain-containing protein [Proteobacteria bacterium]|nr:methyltransferase domain-containing protein [Pseudomonadota bacterium]MBU1714659.1 methyltransferase domain-containing protein [Pseudomonadota bacterium]